MPATGWVRAHHVSKVWLMPFSVLPEGTFWRKWVPLWTLLSHSGRCHQMREGAQRPPLPLSQGLACSMAVTVVGLIQGARGSAQAPGRCRQDGRPESDGLSRSPWAAGSSGPASQGLIWGPAWFCLCHSSSCWQTPVLLEQATSSWYPQWSRARTGLPALPKHSAQTAASIADAASRASRLEVQDQGFGGAGSSEAAKSVPGLALGLVDGRLHNHTGSALCVCPCPNFPFHKDTGQVRLGPTLWP